MKRTPRIYNIPSDHDKGNLLSDEGEPSLCKESNIEEKFVDSMINVIIDLLDINHNDRRIIEPLLLQTLGPILNSYNDERTGMLQQYFACNLTHLGNQIKEELRVPKETKINYNYNNKFSDILKYIKKNYVKVEDINSDGTFDTIYEKQRKESQKCEQETGNYVSEPCNDTVTLSSQGPSRLLERKG